MRNTRQNKSSMAPKIGRALRAVPESDLLAYAHAVVIMAQLRIASELNAYATLNQLRGKLHDQILRKLNTDRDDSAVALQLAEYLESWLDKIE